MMMMMSDDDYSNLNLSNSDNIEKYFLNAKESIIFLLYLY